MWVPVVEKFGHLQAEELVLVWVASSTQHWEGNWPQRASKGRGHMGMAMLMGDAQDSPPGKTGGASCERAAGAAAPCRPGDLGSRSPGLTKATIILFTF